ncbi:alpha/beta-hydrolase [Penicillium malachiteum]|nr:alpha/beta-hydrolase [Penicillium malachiteum]
MSCEACRTIPPVVTGEYTPKGQYEILAGLRTYVTGNQTSTAGIVDIYDIFGLASQTIQGADLLAQQLNAVVLVPDFFQGDGLSHDIIPPDTEEKKTRMGEFLAKKANIPENVKVLVGAIQDYKARFPTVTKWGAFGLCWGGKVTALASGPDTEFAASGQVHPGAMDLADAKALSIPHIVLASKDEPADVVGGYAETISSGKGGYVETYSSMWHGWMGARANLEQEESRAEYVRGYNKLGDFFAENLS